MMTDRIGTGRSAAASVACSDANRHWTSCRVIPAASPEPRQNPVPAITSVDLEHARFPVSSVPLERFFRDRLERRRRAACPAGRQNPDAEPLAVADSGFARLESVASALDEPCFFPRNRCKQGTKQALRPSPPAGSARKNALYQRIKAPKVRCPASRKSSAFAVESPPRFAPWNAGSPHCPFPA